MTTTLIIAGLVCVFLFGFINIFLRLSRIASNIDFASEYRNKFIEFANKYVATYNKQSNPGTLDGDKYVWLTMNVTKIQNAVGNFGIMTFKPAFANYMINNYQIIVNSLPKFRDGSIDNYEVNSVDDCLLRYIGNLEDYRTDAIKNLKNPIIWFREGFKELISLPLFIFYWFGIFSKRTLRFIMNSFIYKMIVGLFAFIAFVSGLVTIIVGYKQSMEIIRKLID